MISTYWFICLYFFYISLVTFLKTKQKVFSLFFIIFCGLVVIWILKSSFRSRFQGEEDKFYVLLDHEDKLNIKKIIYTPNIALKKFKDFI